MKNSKDIMHVRERYNKKGELSFILYCSGKDAFTKKYKLHAKTYKVPNDLKGKKEIEKFRINCQLEFKEEVDKKSKGILANDTNFVVTEKIMTDGSQYAKTIFDVQLNGQNSSTHVTSRSVATENSKQEFISKIYGNEKCFAHSECDAIIKDNAIVTAIPEITANNVEANLIHEAAIGKIAGEQLTKLMTLGLSEKEAEDEIINGFLR